ncbi:MAG TPA: hypothetical protein VFR18_05690, partial [Terriglobia bacterium]|nr:hypothetical protein [Terriglobia bacterium]
AALPNTVAVKTIIGIDPEVIETLVVDFQPAAPIVLGGTFNIASTEKGGTIVGVVPFDWRDAGFAPGQKVQIAGQPGIWEVAAIKDTGVTDDNSILFLSEGTPLIAGANVATTVTALLSGGTVTRSSGNWEDDGFIAGHLVRIQNASISGNWRLREISEDGLTMILEGAQLPDQDDVLTVLSVAGLHGGLTVVHGGGNFPVEIEGDMQITVPGGMPGVQIAVTRLDGLDWDSDRYAIGQLVQVSGENGTRQIVGIVNASAVGVLPPPESFTSWGTHSTLLLGTRGERATGGSLGAGIAERTVHVADPLRIETTGEMDVATSSLTRAAGNWITDGFYVGQLVWISGMAGPFTITSLNATVMGFAGAGPDPIVALTPQDDVNLTVFGFDSQRDGGVRMGGDVITVTGGAGPDSPLVVYGDTSQDGVWYSGHPWDVLGMEFGEKPFDPFPELSDGENEDDEWVFPLADKYTYAGNDIIDAHTLFSLTPAGSLPTVGFTAYGGEGDDIIYGSQTGDHLAGGSGNDQIHGNRGVDHIYGDSGVNVNILTRALYISTVDNSPEPTVDDSLQTNGTTIDPYPSPVRDEMAAGRDVIFGDGPSTILGGPESVYDDIVFADHGEILQFVFDPNVPDPPGLPGALQKIQTTLLKSVLEINSLELQNGDDDVVFGHLGRDILIGGAGNDMIDGDEGDDLLFGDNVFLFRRGGDDGNLVDDITSPHFQTLAGTLLYSRTDRPVPAGFGAVNADNSGLLLTDGIAQNYRDPDGAPWWSEYLIEYSALHVFAMDEGESGVGSFGNDYIAGGQAHDQIFGQLGHDIVQGDGGIDTAFTGTSHVGASRTSGGVSDPLGPLTVSASTELPTDGEDYIEGGGGNDIIFGGLGQDDLAGGSSSFFSLNDPNERPDGDDYIFGGAGLQVDRDGDTNTNTYDLPSDGTTATQRHARDADTIVGDNANIIRIVGTNHVDVNPGGNLAIPQYLSFNYDNYGTMKIIVRGVTLLDYTPGGPDFQPDLFSLTNPGANPAFRDEFGIWATVDIGGHDEVHAETGDDTVYGEGGQDRIFGDADDDDVIGGWGNDWISGGTGQDGVIGDDGRIFTSRNTAGNIALFSEPLYGINFLLATDPDPQHPQIIHGNVINEFVYTPGQVQTATLNVNNALNKAVDITPFNLTPEDEGDDPLSDPIFADDMIFGGLDSDFLHGASGDDAIGGGEALPESYTQRFDADGNVVGLVRTDFTRPWNPGDILHFGTDTDPWNAPKPVQSRLGEFLLYDEYDPRRIILFNAAGQVWKNGAAYPYPYFLNLTSTEGPTENGPIAYAPNGTPTAFAERNTDGDDLIFGDLGNDWQVGGTGRDTIYSGWGNDLANADDVLTTNGGLNDQVDTHPLYADRVYAGAGLDILIGNTAPDRLIDWVGEFNSYIVPFSPFGIDTVSRQVEPQLPEFLYALSASHGADPTRDTDTGNSAVRNGEPDGEMGLIVQQDHGLWQDQTGGPTDPQPGNIPGGRRDSAKAADFNNGSTSSFAVDSGVWKVENGSLSVAAESLGKDAAAVWYADVYLPVYFEIKSDVTVQKPTA